MTKRGIFILAGVAVTVGVVVSVANHLGFGKKDQVGSGRVNIVNQEAFVEEFDSGVENVPIKVEEFVRGLEVPWSIVFTSADRVLVTERTGKVRVVENGKLLESPVAVFGEVSSEDEEGLMGMALDPEYEVNGYVYLSLAYPKNSSLVVKVIRVIDRGDRFEDETVILDDIPAGRFHAGSRIRFGPDGMLYVTTGDAAIKELAGRPDSLAGKILRINADGSVPADNPFSGSLVWSLGHRNPQGIDWYPGTDVLYSTEHGPSGFDGPAGGDEINVIKKGGNYGWPEVSHEQSRDGLVDPLLVFTPAVAPGSGTFYKSEVLPQFTNNFLFGALRGEGLMRVVVSSLAPEEIVLFEKLAQVDVGRVRDVVEGPDGFVYFATSNRDGRGDVRPGDDKIYRIVWGE